MVRNLARVLCSLLVVTAAGGARASRVYDLGCWWEETTAATMTSTVYGLYYAVTEGADGTDYLVEGNYKAIDPDKRPIGWQPAGIAADRFGKIWLPRAGTADLFRFNSTIWSNPVSYAVLPAGMKFAGRDTFFTDFSGSLLFAEVSEGLYYRLAMIEIAAGTPRYAGTLPFYFLGSRPVVQTAWGAGAWELHVFQRASGKIYRSVVRMAEGVTKVDRVVGTFSNINAGDCLDLAVGEGGDLLICNSKAEGNKIHAFRISGTPGVDEVWWGQAYVASNVRLVDGTAQDTGFIVAVAGDLSAIQRITTSSTQWSVNPVLRTGAGPGGADIRWGTQYGYDFVFQDYAGENSVPNPCYRPLGFNIGEIY